MNLAEFWLKVDALTNKPDAHPTIEVKLMTLEGTFPIGSVELQQEGDNVVMYIQSDEPVHREPWEG